MKEGLVIIPTYNEIENIDNMIETVMSFPIFFNLLIVDDNSPDGTSNLVIEKMKKFGNRLFLLQRKGKLGLGTAYIEGFKFGLEQGYKFMYEMDCDFSHDPNDLFRLRETLLKGNDLVIGSRYVEGGNVKNWDFKRIVLSKGASFYTRLITGMPVKDTTSGFVGYSRSFIENLNLGKIIFVGYAFQIQMKFAAFTMGYKIKEIPIIFKDRILGNSKLSNNIIKEAVFGVFKMKINSFKENYHL